MKRVLITGVNSYVGNCLATWLAKYPDEYVVEKISLRDGSWKAKDFSGFDVVVHVAGIAHQKETKENADLYYEVNRDLALEVAQKSKKESTKQFIFLSSMSVYGLEEGIIDENTPENPKSNYGKSKLKAESLIRSLVDESFRVAILRPPMIYGKDCKGNYQRLANLAKKLPVFPNVKNKRSMIYIDNLSEFITLLIQEESKGTFKPQNKDYVCTSELVSLIAQENSKKIHMTRIFNPLIRIMKTNTINKVFGDLFYARSHYEIDRGSYNGLIDLRESIKLTEE